MPLEQLRLGLIEETKTNKINTTSTFADNLSLPVHRWFRYSAGFSATWVRELIEKEKKNKKIRIFDPFTGSGTLVLESEFCRVESAGIEAHPFVTRVARAKLNWRQNPEDFKNHALSILEAAKRNEQSIDIQSFPKLIVDCFPAEILRRLTALKTAWYNNSDNSPLSELTWLTLASILRVCSPVGTAQWQYILPNKTKAKSLDPYEAFLIKLNLMVEDMYRCQSCISDTPTTALYQEDARTCSSIPDGWANLVITSPPYANNYDYADAARLEMSFFGEITGWGDLQDAVRKYLIRSCTQHVTKLRKETYNIINDPILSAICEEIKITCEALEEEREKHGGKKLYHTMIAAYFHDMAKVWTALRRVTSDDSLICFVIGDSAPYGIHVPVDQWLGELAIAAGFRSYSFEKIRDRNIKWKNRKHDVPLHEGHLWVKG